MHKHWQLVSNLNACTGIRCSCGLALSVCFENSEATGYPNGHNKETEGNPELLHICECVALLVSSYVFVSDVAAEGSSWQTYQTALPER
jgi:hypothetical protein